MKTYRSLPIDFEFPPCMYTDLASAKAWTLSLATRASIASWSYEMAAWWKKIIDKKNRESWANNLKKWPILQQSCSHKGAYMIGHFSSWFIGMELVQTCGTVAKEGSENGSTELEHDVDRSMVLLLWWSSEVVGRSAEIMCNLLDHRPRSREVVYSREFN